MGKKRGSSVKFDAAIVYSLKVQRNPERGQFFDLAVDRQEFKVRRDLNFQKFMKTLAEYYNIPVGSFVLWLCKEDSHGNFRPRTVLSSEGVKMGIIWDRHKEEFGNCPKLFVDAYEESATCLASLPNTIMLFFKIHFQGKLSFIGSCYLPKESCLADFESKLLSSRKYDLDVAYEFFKEGADSPNSFGARVGRDATLIDSNFVNGDTVLLMADVTLHSEAGGSKVCVRCYFTSDNTDIPHDCNSLIHVDVALITKSFVPCEERGEFFDFVDKEIHRLEIGRSTTIRDFKQLVYEITKIPMNLLWFWVCGFDGQTFRPRYIWEEEGRLPFSVWQVLCCQNCCLEGLYGHSEN